MSGARAQSRTSSLKSLEPASGATRNLRRFGQSLKRVVREVKEENSVGESRDELVSRNQSLCRAIKWLEESSQLCLSTLVTLHNHYLRSKQLHNVFHRYDQLRQMVKQAIKLEGAWWAVLDIPKQNRAESFSTYLMRVCSTIASARVPGTNDASAFRESDEERETRLEKINEMTSNQVHEQNEGLANTMYKLLKKYHAIRNIIKTLNQEYADSKMYPMFLRYTILKDMIKDVTHHPDYMEHRHESRVPPD